VILQTAAVIPQADGKHTAIVLYRCGKFRDFIGGCETVRRLVQADRHSQGAPLHFTIHPPSEGLHLFPDERHIRPAAEKLIADRSVGRQMADVDSHFERVHLLQPCLRIRMSHTAVAGDDGRDSLQELSVISLPDALPVRQTDSPPDLPDGDIEMGMGIDEARRNHEPAGIQRLVRRRGEISDGDNPVAPDADVRGAGRRG